MRIHTALLALLLLFGCAACGTADDQPKMELPIYPGGEATLEVNLAKEDIAPTIKAMLPLLTKGLGSKAEKVESEDVTSVLKAVDLIQVVQVDIDKQDAGVKDIVSYYCANIPSGKWSRILWQTSEKTGTIALYSKPDAEGLYGFRVRTVKQDEKTIKQVTAARIDGKVDMEKLAALAKKLLS